MGDEIVRSQEAPDLAFVGTLSSDMSLRSSVWDVSWGHETLWYEAPRVEPVWGILAYLPKGISAFLHPPEDGK
jgi:hypothetical protein